MISVELLAPFSLLLSLVESLSFLLLFVVLALDRQGLLNDLLDLLGFSLGLLLLRSREWKCLTLVLGCSVF